MSTLTDNTSNATVTLGTPVQNATVTLGTTHTDADLTLQPQGYTKRFRTSTYKLFKDSTGGQFWVLG